MGSHGLTNQNAYCSVLGHVPLMIDRKHVGFWEDVCERCSSLYLSGKSIELPKLADIFDPAA